MNTATIIESLCREQNRNMARFCLQSANRAYTFERMADSDESRLYWNLSARRWLARFWEVTVQS